MHIFCIHLRALRVFLNRLAATLMRDNSIIYTSYERVSNPEEQTSTSCPYCLSIKQLNGMHSALYVDSVAMVTEQSKRRYVDAQTEASQVQFQDVEGGINGKRKCLCLWVPCDPGAPLSGQAG